MPLEMLQAIVARWLGAGTLLYRLHRQRKIDTGTPDGPMGVRLSKTSDGGNGFRVAMESVKESLQLSVGVL